MKKNIHTAASLALTIETLNTKSDHLKQNIKDSVNSIADHLKPANLIKSGAHSVFNNKNKIIGTGLGLLAGFIGRRLLVGSGASVFGKTAGKMLQWGITVLVSKNADKVRGKAGEFIGKIANKEKRTQKALVY